ncbi:PDZ domain-containing protein [Geobacter sp. FeAm09]|uniref:PDZ domain-containing protein n=1 Tax=Geobacter sp. FeAm09 TaxID=2597769 RepID=UPI00143DC325|nr:PDZ domain-containing protein [Geobacter sp. FeAm09]
MRPDRGTRTMQEKSPAMLDFLGMIVTAVGRASAIRSGMDMADGLIVMVVGWGGTAATAGIETGDIIAGMDGKPTRTLRDIEECLAAHQPRAPITFLLRRAGEWRYLTIPFEENFSGGVHRIQSGSCSISQIKSLEL